MVNLKTGERVSDSAQIVTGGWSYSPLALYTVDLEYDEIVKIADCCDRYLHALLYVFQNGWYNFNREAGRIEILPDVCDELK
jgi:hypothetical protein